MNLFFSHQGTVTFLGEPYTPDDLWYLINQKLIQRDTPNYLSASTDAVGNTYYTTGIQGDSFIVTSYGGKISGSTELESSNIRKKL